MLKCSGSFLSRALRENEPTAKFELSANHTETLNEGESETKPEFSEVGKSRAPRENEPTAKFELSKERFPNDISDHFISGFWISI